MRSVAVSRDHWDSTEIEIDDLECRNCGWDGYLPNTEVDLV
jgi:hypothetical protein